MDKKNKIFTFIFLGLIVAVSTAMRLLPHPANFIPLGALAIFCGVYLRSRWWVLLPLLVMVPTDAIKGWHNLVLFTWGCFVFYAVIGRWVARQKNVWRILGGSLAGGLVFFLITNLAVWAFTPLYGKTLAGLVQCFYMALPFFRNTVLGDIFYVTVFFGAYEAVYYILRQRSQARQSAESKL